MAYFTMALDVPGYEGVESLNIFILQQLHTATNRPQMTCFTMTLVEHGNVSVKYGFSVV